MSNMYMGVRVGGGAKKVNTDIINSLLAIVQIWLSSIDAAHMPDCAVQN